MVGALLGAEGYEVRDAQDGASGLQRALENEPDVLLLDLMMPGEMDGMATLARFREKLPDVPVVMMSGRAGLSDAVRATKLGAFNFLEKPLSPEGVLLALSSALELRQVRREAAAARVWPERRDDRRQSGNESRAGADRARGTDRFQSTHHG
jgi:two-component system nitrogen regulation response regulator NtrX